MIKGEHGGMVLLGYVIVSTSDGAQRGVKVTKSTCRGRISISFGPVVAPGGHAARHNRGPNQAPSKDRFARLRGDQAIRPSSSR